MPWWLAGIIAGIIAGIVMALVAMGLMVVIGHGMLAPIRLLTSTINGDEADKDDTNDLVFGLAVQLAMAVLAGWVFALIVHALGWSTAAVLITLGLLYAIVVFIVNEAVTLQVVDRIVFRRLPPFSFLIAHFVYGGILGWLVTLFIR